MRHRASVKEEIAAALHANGMADDFRVLHFGGAGNRWLAERFKLREAALNEHIYRAALSRGFENIDLRSCGSHPALMLEPETATMPEDFIRSY